MTDQRYHHRLVGCTFQGPLHPPLTMVRNKVSTHKPLEEKPHPNHSRKWDRIPGKVQRPWGPKTHGDWKNRKEASPNQKWWVLCGYYQSYGQRDVGGFQGLVLARQEHHLLAIPRVCPSHFLIKAGEAGSHGTRACEAQLNCEAAGIFGDR